MYILSVQYVPLGLSNTRYNILLKDVNEKFNYFLGDSKLRLFWFSWKRNSTVKLILSQKCHTLCEIIKLNVRIAAGMFRSVDILVTPILCNS